MNRDQIIRMARECKLHIGGPPVMPELERFFAAAYAAGAAAEREACAKIAESWATEETEITCENISRAIRAIRARGGEE